MQNVFMLRMLCNFFYTLKRQKDVGRGMASDWANNLSPLGFTQKVFMLRMLCNSCYTLKRQKDVGRGMYRTGHINRFGNYEINLSRAPDPLEVYMENSNF